MEMVADGDFTAKTLATMLMGECDKLYEGHPADDTTACEMCIRDSACTGSNPRAITPEQMEKLFTCCYYGTEVDF